MNYQSFTELFNLESNRILFLDRQDGEKIDSNKNKAIKEVLQI